MDIENYKDRYERLLDIATADMSKMLSLMDENDKLREQLEALSPSE